MTHFFKLYNQDKFNNDENDELKWLFDVISYKIGQDTQYHPQYALAIKVIALNFAFKVYFDFGFSRIVE